MTRFDHIVCAVAEGLLAQEGRVEIGVHTSPTAFAESVMKHAEAIEIELVKREQSRSHRPDPPPAKDSRA